MITKEPSSLNSQAPIERSLDQCIKCNTCVSKCPVVKVIDLFPGPKYEGPQAARFRAPGQVVPDRSVDYCSGCRVCNMSCPTGVKIAEINARARANIVEQGKLPIQERFRNNLISRPELLGKLGSPLAPLANNLLSNRISRRATEAAIGIHHQAPIPSFSKIRFTTWFRQHRCQEKVTRKVVYFHGCSTEYYEPRIGRAAIRVLETNGFEVVVPPQNCCGLPLLSNGIFKTARRYHQNNVRQLVIYARQGIPIVGTSPSCTLTLKEEAPELLNMYDEDSQLVAQHTYDFNEFLLHLLDAGTLNTDFQSLPYELAYHAPCQYRAHRLGKPAMELLDLIPGLTLIDSHADCCGIAGTYGYKEEKYRVAMAVGDPLFEFVKRVNGPVAVCDSETCRWQITHGTGTPTIHPVELLAAAYGCKVEGPLKVLLRHENR